MQQFVKVRHSDGREADITAAELVFYGSLGFTPVDGQVIGDAAAPAPRGTETLQPPANGAEQRLDLLITELRGLRADLALLVSPAGPSEPADGETVELREPVSIDHAVLAAMKREDLNAHAASIGIADPASFPTKPELIKAITEAGAV